MGNSPPSSPKLRERQPSEDTSVQESDHGLLSIEDLALHNYSIENLVFAGGSAEGFSYAGAVSVLEKLGLLPGIKRFAGVGTGAIVAAFLAFGLNSEEIQTACGAHLISVLGDDQVGYDDLLKNLTETYGWNSGTKFTDWFGRFLESRCFLSELTFSELYAKTGKELCVIVTNVDKLIIEYCHPKTTPDLPIRLAVFMSLSIPGIFAPIKYGPGIEKCHYVSGSLMCNYPIHAFDGWLLSMKYEDSFLNRIDSPSDFLSPDMVFDCKNTRTLGFFHISKHREMLYKEFVDRLANADLMTPCTTLGEKYKTATEERIFVAKKFSILRRACSTLLFMADELENGGKIPVDSFAEKIFTDESLTRDDYVLFFPEFGGNQDDLKCFLSDLFVNDSICPQLTLEAFLQRKLLSLSNAYSDYCKINVTNLHTYFSTVFAELPYFAMNLAKSDFDRSVGILCGHVGSCDVILEEDDQTFLYRQGWNATISYFGQIGKQTVQCQITDSVGLNC